MSSNTDDAVPGPSSADDATPGSSKDPEAPQIPKEAFLSSRRKVTISEEPTDEEPAAKEPAAKEPQRKDSERKKSVIGTAGYVTQLVEELDEKFDFRKGERRKTIRELPLEERRQTIQAVEADMISYMKQVTRASVAEESVEKLPTLATREKFDELTKMSETKVDKDHPAAEWLPSKILAGKAAGDRTGRSWVGTYTVGKDYWKEDEEKEEEIKEVRFNIDDEKKPWYELPLTKATIKDSVFFNMKSKTLDKVEELKIEMDDEYRKKRKERIISASDARDISKSGMRWTDDFKKHFHDVAKTGEFSHRGTHLAMATADNWLEKAGILDHVNITLLHTGFCFLASGGSRHRGLSFPEFTQYLQMISYTCGRTLSDLVRCLEVSLRQDIQKDTNVHAAKQIKTFMKESY